ncbi:MAG: hypothetical protein A3G32_00585 [Deltaproteobacteria bacterium RIFCSPLOWO2_12_FULL_40_28]|nr:MAG: hypothetical protein A3C45_10320 [Deltaproteobacteria bacterium RIFCSPHIGHO2_02_FULL_40_28]OGQ20186.1 MAG: hypothetical protein A3E27_01105 [Deltaproteobacteria bacterium RIFCSPHIGHO2_12_FULL_40_32]OGQ40177.1 MAG: hypothetical protein A3I69_09055 [Deltaproteobacteria bacterium RIFCSPLOWO2_02_FULL_40_36]OGQ54741.1 MAG: hypothetical protein A3G32_00585 [Deltaproteobacteria bacterium RIFCSPLOWO2_12_FULL_40_28]
MKDQYPLKLTFGQTLFGILCLTLLGFALFYLGARFGPELLWGLNLDRFRENPLLPTTLSDNELEALLKEESNKNMIFNKYLESDTGVIFRSGIPDQVEEIHEDVVSKPVEKTHVILPSKPSEKPLEAVLSEVLQKPQPAPVKVLDQNQKGNFMQLGSFFSEEEATRFAGKLAKQGIPAHADNLMQNGGKYYLNLGPFLDEESMHQAKKQIKQDYGMNATAPGF